MSGNPLQPIRDCIFDRPEERWPAAHTLAHLLRKAHIGDEREERGVLFEYLREMLVDADHHDIFVALVNGVLEPLMQAPELLSVVLPWSEDECERVRMAAVLGTEKMDWIYKKRMVASALIDEDSEVRDAAAGSVFYTLKYQEKVDSETVASFWSEYADADVDPEIRKEIGRIFESREIS